MLRLRDIEDFEKLAPDKWKIPSFPVDGLEERENGKILCQVCILLLLILQLQLLTMKQEKDLTLSSCQVRYCPYFDTTVSWLWLPIRTSFWPSIESNRTWQGLLWYISFQMFRLQQKARFIPPGNKWIPVYYISCVHTHWQIVWNKWISGPRT